MKFLTVYLRKAFLMLLIVSVLLATPMISRKAEAQCCGCCTCWASTVIQDLMGWVQNWIEINLHIFISLFLHRIYFWDYQFNTLYLTPLLTSMAEQLTAVGMQQMQIIGGFLDATEQLQAQRDLQRMMVRAHKDYHPSISMCEFGTRVKSLAMSERRGELTALAMSQRSLDRMLGNKSSVAPYGRLHDMRNRLAHYREEYCDRADNNGALRAMCTGPLGPATTVQIDKYNRDVDYTRTLAHPYTLNIDMTNNTLSEQEEDVLALGNNLYGFVTFPGVDPTKIANDPSKRITSVQQAYLDMRAYIAKQSVAENSFNALVALKSEGTVGSRAFMEAYMRELGTPAGEVAGFLGANPSYHAQMEILTKLAYQHPSFYTNLYDKPANVERKGVAIQAIGLMQKFDMLKSYLRTEASLSVLLELTVEDLQNEVETSIMSLNISTERRI